MGKREDSRFCCAGYYLEIIVFPPHCRLELIIGDLSSSQVARTTKSLRHDMASYRNYFFNVCSLFITQMAQTNLAIGLGPGQSLKNSFINITGIHVVYITRQNMNN